MSIYLKQIEQLVALQQIDCEIIELKHELETAPREVEALETNFAGMEERKGQILDKLGILKEQQTRLDSEIDDDYHKIKKSKNKLMMASNTKEYHAMMREMDGLEKLNRLREEEKITLVEELQRQEEALAELGSEIDRVGKELDAKKANLAERIKTAEEKLTTLGKARKASCNLVPVPVLSRYEFIRSRLSAPVIVSVQAGVCDGCHIAIPPQSFIELQKGQQILSCPNCQRLIYWCEHFSAPRPSPKRVAEAPAQTVEEAAEV